MFHSFLSAISWNVLNVFLYKILLQTHQAFLFWVMSKEMFGLSGTLFSAIYFLISVTNLGFDYVIITHHKTYTQSQQAFQKLMPLGVLRILCSALALGVLYTVNQVTPIHPIQFITHQTSGWLFAILILIFFSESLKKSLDVMAQMSFLQKSITLFDISTLGIYILSVWGWYAVMGTITLYTIFIPMSIISIMECLLLGHRLHRYYRSLPEHVSIQLDGDLPSRRTIIMQQLGNYINQITKALFSPNFFIILLAYNLGMAKAGYIKLFTDIIILMYMLLNRSFGLPSAALFSSMGQKNGTGIARSSLAFVRITNWYIQFLYVLSITFFAVIVPYLLLQSTVPATIALNIIIFAFAGFIEYIIIAYEKWYLTQNKAWLLAFINSISLMQLAALLYFVYIPCTIPVDQIMIRIVALRLCSIVTMIAVTYQQWNIIPSWRPRLRTLLITIPTALAAFTALFIFNILF